MRIISTYELLPATGSRQKSFYSKARVERFDNGFLVLRSYETEVAAIAPDGTQYRLWRKWSATTSRHVNAFGISCNKSEWMQMKVWDLMLAMYDYKSRQEKQNAV